MLENTKENMKNLLSILVILLGMFTIISCEKEGLEPADVIINQGSVHVLVDGVVFTPGQKVIVPHKEFYEITCEQEAGCKVNINGGIYYESGRYHITFHLKHKF